MVGKNVGFVLCMLFGCMILFDSVVFLFCGLDVVVIGKLNIVGKLVVLMLFECECMVMVMYIVIKGLVGIVCKVDIVVVVVGYVGLVCGDWVKFGVVVIDVGINCVEWFDGIWVIVGDVCVDEMVYVCVVMLVFGGVGLMMVVCLMVNIVSVVCVLVVVWVFEYV